jgi:DNA modification methylase
MLIRLITGDCRTELARLESGSVHSVVTSPPFFGLRDYGTGEWSGGDPGCRHVVGEMRRGLGLASSPVSTRGGAVKIAETPDILARSECPHCGAMRVDRQIGLEPTPEVYIETLVEVFREVWRVLRDDGTCWLNLGDSYVTNPKGSNGDSTSRLTGNAEYQRDANLIGRKRPAMPGAKSKDLMFMPARVAMALQADGWYVRSDIIWSKPNAMPESVTDRPSSSYEHLFLLAKKERYFYDAIAIMVSRSSDEDANGFRGGSYTDGRKDNATLGKRQARGNRKIKGVPPYHAQYDSSGRASLDDVARGGLRNIRNVWDIATVPYKDAHFATFPAKLAEPCIKAGTSARGCCPDCGAGWRRISAKDTAWASNSARAGNLELAGKGHPSDQVREDHDVRNGPVAEHRTIGWFPGCDCYGLEPLPEYPERPKRSVLIGNSKAAASVKKYEKAIAAWREACSIVDRRRHEACTGALTRRTVPATVLDPFGGAGTVALVANRHGRDSVLIELNPVSSALTRERIRKDAGMLARIVET